MNLEADSSSTRKINFSPPRKKKKQSKMVDPRESLGEFDSSIFDASDGHKLVALIRRKKGLNVQTQKIFDDVPSNRPSLNIEIQRLDEEKENETLKPPETIQQEPNPPAPSNAAAEINSEVPPTAEFVPKSPKRTSIRRTITSPIIKMSSTTLGRRTLLKEFEKAFANESRFLPEICSTPICSDMPNKVNQANTNDLLKNTQGAERTSPEENVVCSHITISDEGSPAEQLQNTLESCNAHKNTIRSLLNQNQLLNDLLDGSQKEPNANLLNERDESSKKSPRRTYTVECDISNGKITLSPSKARQNNEIIPKVPTKKLVSTPEQLRVFKKLGLVLNRASPTKKCQEPTQKSSRIPIPSTSAAPIVVNQETTTAEFAPIVMNQETTTAEFVEHLQKKATPNCSMIVIPVNQTFNQIPADHTITIAKPKNATSPVHEITSTISSHNTMPAGSPLKQKKEQRTLTRVDSPSNNVISSTTISNDERPKESEHRSSSTTTLNDERLKHPEHPTYTLKWDDIMTDDASSSDKSDNRSCHKERNLPSGLPQNTSNIDTNISQLDEGNNKEIESFQKLPPPPGFCDVSVHSILERTTSQSLDQDQDFVDELITDRIALSQDAFKRPSEVIGKKKRRKTKAIPKNVKEYLDVNKKVGKNRYLNISKRKLYSKGNSFAESSDDSSLERKREKDKSTRKFSRSLSSRSVKNTERETSKNDASSREGQLESTPTKRHIASRQVVPRNELNIKGRQQIRSRRRSSPSSSDLETSVPQTPNRAKNTRKTNKSKSKIIDKEAKRNEEHHIPLRERTTRSQMLEKRSFEVDSEQTLVLKQQFESSSTTRHISSEQVLQQNERSRRRPLPSLSDLETSSPKTRNRSKNTRKINKSRSNIIDKKAKSSKLENHIPLKERSTRSLLLEKKSTEVDSEQTLALQQQLESSSTTRHISSKQVPQRNELNLKKFKNIPSRRSSSSSSSDLETSNPNTTNRSKNTRKTNKSRSTIIEKDVQNKGEDHNLTEERVTRSLHRKSTEGASEPTSNLKPQLDSSSTQKRQISSRQVLPRRTSSPNSSDHEQSTTQTKTTRKTNKSRLKLIDKTAKSKKEDHHITLEERVTKSLLLGRRSSDSDSEQTSVLNQCNILSPSRKRNSTNSFRSLSQPKKSKVRTSSFERSSQKTKVNNKDVEEHITVSSSKSQAQDINPTETINPPEQSNNHVVESNPEKNAPAPAPSKTRTKKASKKNKEPSSPFQNPKHPKTTLAINAENPDGGLGPRRSKREKKMPTAYWACSNSKYTHVYDIYTMLTEGKGMKPYFPEFLSKPKSKEKDTTSADDNLVANTNTVDSSSKKEKTNIKQLSKKQTNKNISKQSQSTTELPSTSGTNGTNASSDCPPMQDQLAEERQSSTVKSPEKTKSRIGPKSKINPKVKLKKSSSSEQGNSSNVPSSKPSRINNNPSTDATDGDCQTDDTEFSNLQTRRLTTIAEDAPTQINHQRNSSTLMPPPKTNLVKKVNTIRKNNSFHTEHDDSIADVSAVHVNNLFDQLKNSSMNCKTMNRNRLAMNSSEQVSLDSRSNKTKNPSKSGGKQKRNTSVLLQRLNLEQEGSYFNSERNFDSGFSSDQMNSINTKKDILLDWLVQMINNCKTPSNQEKGLARLLKPDGFAIGNVSELTFEEIDGVDYAFYNSNDQKFGYLRFKPRTQKKISKAKRYELNFVLLGGIIEISVNKQTFDMKNGDLITIFIGTSYGMKNVTDDPALVMVIRK
ncbi:uncharacterized protein LOC129939673 isoform X2 [Eupeodes corollae]|uniref:uncharacterized protein LOC129939673 isoform X2 n=1 Tax=Eupeodes corollae TaxID=290404 RepID=UPI0024901EBB|nr:uncharacterized protein LOC129939673 isoform X2 [Eupeodes corollae]